MVIADAVFLVVVAPLALILSLHSTYLLLSGKAERKPASDYSAGESISIVIPIKSEPIDLVYESVSYLSKLIEKLKSSTNTCIEIYIVSDDEEEYVKTLRNKLESLNSPVPVRVVRRSGQGGRVGALNFALKEVVKNENLLVLDIDAKPSEKFLEELVSCVQLYDACVGHWEGYWVKETRIARALAFTTELVATALYRGRQKLGLLIFPLGSGTLFRVKSLKAVGGWEDGTVQDDVIIGMKLHGSGFRVGYSDKAILRVLVPSSYRAFRIQQLKWAYGSVESLRYSFKYLKGDIGILKSIEARLYTLQYVPGLSVLATSIVIPSIAIAVNSDLSYYSLLAVSAISSFYVGAVLKTFSKPDMGAMRILRLLGTSSAIGLTVAPVVMKGLILGILGKRPRAPVTPKGSEDRERYREYLEEYVTTIASFLLGVVALIKGHYLASGIGFLPTIALVYTLMRATRPLHTFASVQL
ncbi:MAG: glycosyltransferase family 2 protein [Sulfolobales archaeon]